MLKETCQTYYFSTQGTIFLASIPDSLPDDVLGLANPPPTLPVFRNACIFFREFTQFFRKQIFDEPVSTMYMSILAAFFHCTATHFDSSVLCIDDIDITVTEKLIQISEFSFF